MDCFAAIFCFIFSILSILLIFARFFFSNFFRPTHAPAYTHFNTESHSVLRNCNGFSVKFFPLLFKTDQKGVQRPMRTYANGN